MGLAHSPSIVLNGLVFALDAGNTKSLLNTVEVLVVAGGGGGGMDMGGGGGGGGVIYSSTVSVTPGVAHTVTVGAGGYGAPAGNGGYRTDGAGPQPSNHQFTISATNGGNSVFGSLTAIGGGYGGSSYYGYLPNYGLGASGGSGGGSSGYTAGATTIGASGTSGQGFKGGNAGVYSYASGGGGGAGGAGVDAPNQPDGGPGVCYPLISPYYFGGGGGGASYSLSTGGNGGIGGGGGGALGTTYGGAGLNNGSPGGGGSPNSQTNTPGGNAGANTGGGGGGGSHYNVNNKGGEGGSGIVFVRYPGVQRATGGTVTSSGGYTIHTFTTVGSSTFTPLTLADLSGGSNTGTLINGPTYSSANGGSIVFDGVNDYIDLNTNNIITGTNPFTFEAFYTITNTSVSAEIFGNFGTGYTSNTIWISGRYGVFINGSVPYFQGYPLGAGTYHMAFTRTSTGDCILYKNAIVDGTATSTTSISVGQNFRIGSDVNVIGEVFGGNLYNLKVYNRVLTAAEVSQNFNALRGRYGI